MDPATNTTLENFWSEQEKYRLVFELSPEAVVLMNRAGIIMETNGRMVEWLGYDFSEIQGKSLLQLPFFDAKNKVIVMKHFAKRVMGQEVPPYDLEFIAKNGQRKIGQIRGTTIKDHAGQIHGSLVMVTDVTAQKSSKLVFDSLIEAIPDGVIVISIAGVLEYVSAHALEILGYQSADELMGKQIIDYIAPKDVPIFQSALESVMKQGMLRNIVLNVKRKDSVVITVEVSGSILTDSAGAPEKILGIFRDITQKAANEHAMRKKNEELEHLSKLMVGRELAMTELKKENQRLKEKLNVT